MKFFHASFLILILSFSHSLILIHNPQSTIHNLKSISWFYGLGLLFLALNAWLMYSKFIG